MLSIIIPTYKRLEILKEVYEAIQLATERMGVEIIVVNDDHGVESIAVAAFIQSDPLNTRVVNNLKKGAAAARNMGASLATGDLLLFLDDDILINHHTISRLIALHSNFDRMMSTPIWIYSPEMVSLLQASAFGRYRITYDYTTIKGEKGHELKEDKQVFKVDTLASFCLSIKKKHYEELKGMDEAFPFAGCEDQEFAFRAKAAGFLLLLDENSTVLHHELDRIARAGWLKRQFNGVQGFVLLCERFPERKHTALWKENVPLNKQDSLKLKFKKILKLLMRQAPGISFFNMLVSAMEKLNAPEKTLYSFYSKQAGVAINKGFTKSYHDAHRTPNGQ